MPRPLKPADADALAAFARAARPLAAQAVRLVGPDPDRLLAHWRAEVAVLAAAPGLGGRLVSAAQGLTAAAAQGTLVVALCQAAGVREEREVVRVLAGAVMGRELPAGWQPPAGTTEPAPGVEGGLGARLLALGRLLNSNRRVVAGREEGRLWHRAVAMVPVAGAAGALLGQRHALVLVAERARRLLGTAPGATAS